MSANNWRWRPPLEGLQGLGVSVFGAAATSEISADISAFASRFGDSRVWNQFAKLSGSIAYSDGEAVLSTGTTQFAYQSIQTVRNLSYHPGRGARFFWTQRHPDGGVAGALQIAGPYQGEDGLGVGYNGTQFGLFHRYDRRQAIEVLEITAAASGAETATVTLNGTAHAVSVTAGTVEDNAREIAEFATGYSDSGGLIDYAASAIGDKVYFQRLQEGDAAGTFSVSSTGTLAGTFTGVQTGASGTQDWAYQGSWNIDNMDGTGPSESTIDVDKGNVWGLTLGWLGYAGATFWVRDPDAPRMLPIHHVQWSGTDAATKPFLADPRLPLTVACASLGSTTDVSMAVGSFSADSEGDARIEQGPPFATVATETGVGTGEAVIVAVQCAIVDTALSKVNRRRLSIDSIDLGDENTKAATFRVYRGTTANLAGYEFTQPDQNSPLLVDTASTSIAGSPTLILAVQVQAGETQQITFDSARAIPLTRGRVLIVTAQTSASTTDVTVTINGFEDP